MMGRHKPRPKCADCGEPVSARTVVRCKDCQAEYQSFVVPPPDELRRRCEEIQAEWTPYDRLRHLGYSEERARAMLAQRSVEFRPRSMARMMGRQCRVRDEH
ncbi:MAG: hypothetical protein WD066_18600 [Planctomycetaceae bacterium]